MGLHSENCNYCSINVLVVLRFKVYDVILIWALKLHIQSNINFSAFTQYNITPKPTIAFKEIWITEIRMDWRMCGSKTYFLNYHLIKSIFHYWFFFSIQEHPYSNEQLFKNILVSSRLDQQSHSFHLYLKLHNTECIIIVWAEWNS